MINESFLTSLRNFIFTLVGIILTPFLTSIGSKVATGDWLRWFKFLPYFPEVWITVPIGVITLVIMVIVIRIKQLKKYGISRLVLGVADYPTRAKYPHEDVIWHIGIRDLAMSASDVEAKIPPRCPVCETKLNQTRSFWGGYIWSCPRKDFKKNKNMSFYDVVKDVENLAGREWERRNP